MALPMPRKPKKERLPFWKSEKLPPELRSLFVHIGKAADNMTHSQWSELLMNGGLAALSAWAFAPKDKNGNRILDLSMIPNAFIGPIALKLATSGGGTPPVSQISGLIVLSALGVATMSGLGTLPSASENLKAWHATDWTFGLSEPFKEAIKKDPIKFGI